MIESIIIGYFLIILIGSIWIEVNKSSEIKKVILRAIANLLQAQIFFERHYSDDFFIHPGNVKIQQTPLSKYQVYKSFRLSSDLMRHRSWDYTQGIRERQMSIFINIVAEAIKEQLSNNQQLIKIFDRCNDPLSYEPEQYYLFEFWIDEKK